MYYTKNTQLTFLKLGNDPLTKEDSKKILLQPFTEFIINEILEHRGKYLQVIANSEHNDGSIPENQPFWIKYSQFDLSDIPSEIFCVIPENKLVTLFPKDCGCIPFLNKYMSEYEIVDRSSIWCFLASVAQETGGLRLTKQLGKNLPKYCGRGIILQLTGEGNYQAFENDTGLSVVEQPELLEQPEFAVMSGCWFWHKHNLNNITKTYSIDNFEKATKVLTGGRPQWSERITWIAKIKNYLK
jgi:putative chitinase